MSEEQRGRAQRPSRGRRGGSRAAAGERGLHALSAELDRRALPLSAETPTFRSGRLVYILRGDCAPLRRDPGLLERLRVKTERAASEGEERRQHCFIDLDGEVSTRQGLLEVIAQDTASVVQHTRRRAIVEGLVPFERRELHEYIKRDEENDGEIETESEGVDPTRYLIISSLRGS
ncbi:MAG: R3H domain-containing nucleic acid-binding protein [Myxococcota bacterium]|nr:R3H domain-containing nucleic acid-binding protein [Myxococcota bacterium]